MVIKKNSVESSFETPGCQDRSLGAEELNSVASSELAVCRIMARKELGCAKKISHVI
jgi:hypothetical protein